MRTRGRRIVRIGSRKECFHGLSILQSLGLNPTVDNLKISFSDPVALSADLCKMQNRYAFQGRFQGKYDFQTRQNVIPVLYIDGQDMGTIDNLKIQALKGLAEPSLAADENVKKVWEIKANRINLDLDLTQDIQVLAPMGHKIVPKFSKLVIYEKDGVFTEHSDSHEENHFGSLVIVLPVPYEGGNFILSENANELTLPFDDMFKRNKIPWIAFYSDVKYKVEVANSGVRMILQYTLTAEKNGPKEDYSIRSKIEGRYSREPESRYRFKGYNEEVMTLIRDKLNTIFAQLKEKAIEESKTDEQQKENMEEEKIEVEKEKEEKDEEEEEDEEDEEEYDYYQDKNKESLKIDNTPPEGIAIMLKRRYEKSSSSLKGSDSTLYNYLKQHFTVDLKQIILEQNHNDYPFRDDLIEIVAISQIDDLQESCSSEEELQLGPDNMRVPSKCSKKGTQNRALKMTHQQKFGKKKRVFLVSGLCPQNLKKLVDRYGDENADDPDKYNSVYSYIHSALFIYPKN